MSDNVDRLVRPMIREFEPYVPIEPPEVLAKRESKSRPNVGIVSFHTTGYNQEGTTVITFKRTVMVFKRGHVPQRVKP